jgi:monoamine oxidase
MPLTDLERRKFIQRAGLASAGLATLLYGCTKPTALKAPHGFDEKVAIIGAGAAGMYAAKTLKLLGIDHVIVEASDRIGGRLGRIDGFTDYPLDSGAEWLHGKRSIIGKLVRQTKTPIVTDYSAVQYWFRDRLRSRLPLDIQRAMEAVAHDQTLSIYDYYRDSDFEPDYESILESIAAEAGTSSRRLSLGGALDESDAWKSGLFDYKFRGTYFDFMNQHVFSDGVDQVLRNRPVSKIDYRGKRVKVYRADGDLIEADKVIITVPITVLKEGDIEFIPALPEAKNKAFAMLGMDAGMKVFLTFKADFAQGNILGGRVCPSYLYANWGKPDDGLLLLAFVMGRHAEALQALEDKQIIDTLVNELEMMFPRVARRHFKDAYIQDWGKEPFIRGAYSYRKPGIGDPRRVISVPIDNKLFFAGEATNYDGANSTVHGAAESGLREVRRILRAAERRVKA